MNFRKKLFLLFLFSALIQTHNSQAIFVKPFLKWWWANPGPATCSLIAAGLTYKYLPWRSLEYWTYDQWENYERNEMVYETNYRKKYIQPNHQNQSNSQLSISTTTNPGSEDPGNVLTNSNKESTQTTAFSSIKTTIITPLVSHVEPILNSAKETLGPWILGKIFGALTIQIIGIALAVATQELTYDIILNLSHYNLGYSTFLLKYLKKVK
jgi:hypothetical protein